MVETSDAKFPAQALRYRATEYARRASIARTL